MLIGVLTFHNTTNYGAIYQTYALQKFINDKGIACEVINYNNSVLLNRYSYNPFEAKSFKEFIKRVLYFKNNYSLFKKFKIFTKNYINLSSKSYNESNIKLADNYYDTFIAGSDQIWNVV